MKKSRLYFPLALIAGDFLAIVSAFVIAYIARVTIDPRPLIEQIPALDYLIIFLSILPFWLLIFGALGLYNKSVYERKTAEIWRLGLGSFAGMLFILGYDFVYDPSSTIFPARLVAVYALLLGFSLLVLERQILWQLKKLAYRYGYGVERVMIIGNSPATKELIQLLNHTYTSGYEIVAVVGQKEQLPDDFTGKHYPNLKKGLNALTRLNINTVIQTQWYDAPHRNEEIQAAAQKRHIEYKLMLAESNLISGAVEIELFHFFPVIAAHPTPLLGWGRVAKRFVDIVLSGLGIIVLSPLMLLIVLLIKVFDPGPVLFKQKRLTRWGKQTTIYKFRTMKKKYSGRDPKKVFAELGQPELFDAFQKNRGKVENDPRISRLGHFLRKTSLDELPQLFNIFTGRISLVGPRTILKDEAEQSFREQTPLLLSVKTGLTGLAQVSGRSDIPMEERIRLDLYYVQNWSLWLDMKIILKTIWVVFTRDGSK